jgi:hypothetical protein
MKLIGLEVPAGAAASMLALALLAGVVAGGEKADEPKVIAPRDSIRVEPTASEDLDVARLVRTRTEQSAPDLFSNPLFVPPPVAQPTPPPVAKPEPPPAPVAPPLPYAYLGRMNHGERQIVYVLKNQDMLIAERGETLENAYRVEDISDASVVFVYLPLGTKQVLSIPPAQ